MTAWVIQRAHDGKFFNGFRTAPWSKCVSAAIAYETRELAMLDMQTRGWSLLAMRFLLLPKARVPLAEKPYVAPIPRRKKKDLPS